MGRLKVALGDVLEAKGSLYLIAVQHIGELGGAVFWCISLDRLEVRNVFDHELFRSSIT
jgi:hypothetical protein